LIQQHRSLVDELAHVDGKAEIVNGEIVRMSPAGRPHNRRAGRIYASLLDFEIDHGAGQAFTDNQGFLVDLPGRDSFSPDAAWLACDPADDAPGFIEGPPTFAVEVRSPGDTDRAILAKIADYFVAGTLVVWDVDADSDEVIRCYRAANPTLPQAFRRGEVAEAEPAVPGWRFEVDELFF
jgi:Uma2 family endonuclease